jgi:hypothetical protein
MLSAVRNTPTLCPVSLTHAPHLVPAPAASALHVQMLAELAISLRDDLRPHMPELLPRLVALFVDAERTGNFEMVKPGLEVLEVRLCRAVLARMLYSVLCGLLPCLHGLLFGAVWCCHFPLLQVCQESWHALAVGLNNHLTTLSDVP